MKKFLACLLAVCLCFSLAACGNKNKDTGTPTGSASSGENAGPTEIPEAVRNKEAGKNIITGYKSGDVKLGQYTGLTYKPMSTEVTEEEVLERLDQFMEYYKNKVEITDRDTVQKGDIVEIEYEGFKDGEKRDDASGSIADLQVGEYKLIPDLEDKLIGKSKGTFTIEAKFPENTGYKDLSGVQVVFNINLKGIYKYEYPEVTDAFITEKTNNNYTTVEAFKENLKSQIKTGKEEEAAKQKEYDLVEKLIENTTYNIDMEEEIQRGMASLKRQYDDVALTNFGMDAAGYYSTLGLTYQQYEDMLRAEAELSVRYEFAYSAIAEAERFEVTDKEVEDIGRKIMYTYGYTDLDAFYKKLEEVNGIDGKTYIAEMTKLNKAADLVFDTAIAEE